MFVFLWDIIITRQQSNREVSIYDLRFDLDAIEEKTENLLDEEHGK